MVYQHRCAGIFDPVTCSCSCEMWRFGEKKSICERMVDAFWDPESCRCRTKTMSAREVERDRRRDGERAQMPCMGEGQGNNKGNQIVDLLGWTITGQIVSKF